MNKNHPRQTSRLQRFFLRRALLIWLYLSGGALLYAQTNLVPNPGFEELTDCDLHFGDVPKASPWKIIDPSTSPDLFHYCSTSGSYRPPAGCQGIDPKDGEGMIGQVHLQAGIEERVYARLLDDLPRGVDLYVAFSTVPSQKCGMPSEILCYSNTPCLAFSDYAFQSQVVVLEPDTIITNTTGWTTMRTCYRATGNEDFVLLGNYRSAVGIRQDCDNTDPFNFAYFFIDEVIVAPFDVVPDTILLCEGQELELDATFYDVPIRWSDGWQGAIRTISGGGRYIALGNTGNCFLRDTTVVILIPEEQETVRLTLCEDEALILQAPVPALWDTGDTSMTLPVTHPGIYTARLQSACGERTWNYVVEEAECSIRYFVPNAFSPNGDGINDQLDFFFRSDDAFSGELHIFDRWGSLLFRADVDQSTPAARWNGTHRGKPLGPGVFVWVYRYLSARDGRPRVISGDFILLR